ncbi:unnamed protein product [Sphagnum troendelagicum]|uniref:Ubiquitin-like protease family profile domain-containing protein n=1 Tax=Sphagnum troendelagicum TaxID=128251 RepID=A0ABP0T814_9BRYO
MKESTMNYARKTWTMPFEDDEYDNYLLELYEECRLPKKEGQKRHEWQCQYCRKVFKCVLRLNFHRITGCPAVGMLKMYPVVHKYQQAAAEYTLCQKGFMNFKEQPAFEHSKPKKRPRQMIEKTLRTTVHNDDIHQHTTMPESTASPPGPSKGGMQQIGYVPDMNRHTTQQQHTSDCMQTEEEKTPIPQTYAGHEGLKMKMQELLNDGHNVLNTKVIFFKDTAVEIPLGMSALTPLTTEDGKVNDELMDWYFAYYHTYGPQNAFEECVIANSFVWEHLKLHVSKDGDTEDSLKAFVERRLAKRHTRCNTLIVPICDSKHWSLMILERGKYYHMNPMPEYGPHSNNLQMRIWFAKCWEIMQGNYNRNEVDDPILDKWMQPNVPTQTGSWECGWFVLKYFDMYIQQRFVATEMEEFERVQFTEDWFAYDDAIAMRKWLEEAIRTELFGPTFENSGPWQLMKSSRRDWIAPQASRCVSEESEQSSALMHDNPLKIRGSPHSRQSNSATEHMDTHKGVQEGTITPNTGGSPARSKTKTQLEMEGHMDFIQECAVEDEKWKWSPLYLLLRDYSPLSTCLPRPWKHTAEEWEFVREFIATNQATKIEYHGDRLPIVAALYFTWKFHFDECIEDVELSKLRDRLEDASKEKEFVNNLLRIQDIMMSRWNGWSEREIQEQRILANDVTSFKATSKSPRHQEVIKRICSHFVGFSCCVMEDTAVYHSQQLKDMWIGDHLKSEQEMLIKFWRNYLFETIEEKKCMCCDYCILSIDIGQG